MTVRANCATCGVTVLANDQLSLFVTASTILPAWVLWACPFCGQWQSEILRGQVGAQFVVELRRKGCLPIPVLAPNLGRYEPEAPPLGFDDLIDLHFDLERAE